MNELILNILKADILFQVQSTSIAQYKEHGKSKDNSIYWIVMERLHGYSLDHLFDAHSPLPEIEVIKVCKFI